MEDPVYLDAINSLLISGEYPHLFTNDEMEGLLQVNNILDRLRNSRGIERGGKRIKLTEPENKHTYPFVLLKLFYQYLYNQCLQVCECLFENYTFFLTIFQAIGPAMKREFPSLSVDPMKFFVARVKSNLHIVMCLQPMNSLLKLSAR